MPTLRKTSFLVLAILLCFVYFLFTMKYLISLVLVVPLILSFILMRKLVTEELVIHWLFKHGYEADYDRIVTAFPKTGGKTIERLIKKGIVKRLDNRIILIIRDYKFSMTRGSIKSRGSEKDTSIKH